MNLAKRLTQWMTRRNEQAKPRSTVQRLLRGTGWAAATFVMVTAFSVLALRWFDPPVTMFMLVHNQQPLAKTKRDWLPRSALGDACALTVMAAEDQNFPNHHGVDFGAIAKALEDQEREGRLRGASGISQQLAKNLFLWPSRSLLRKGLEAYLAMVLDLLLPKARILELYLNVVELGPGIYGVTAASRHYFGREPARLSLTQAALLAAVLPNPNRLRVANPSDYVRSRQAWIEEQAARLQREGWLQSIDW